MAVLGLCEMGRVTYLTHTGLFPGTDETVWFITSGILQVVVTLFLLNRIISTTGASNVDHVNERHFYSKLWLWIVHSSLIKLYLTDPVRIHWQYNWFKGTDAATKGLVTWLNVSNADMRMCILERCITTLSKVVQFYQCVSWMHLSLPWTCCDETGILLKVA